MHTEYVVEYWAGKEDAISKPASGEWIKFPLGEVRAAKGNAEVWRLAEHPDRDAVPARVDDAVFKHLRHARPARSAQLCGLRNL